MARPSETILVFLKFQSLLKGRCKSVEIMAGGRRGTIGGGERKDRVLGRVTIYLEGRNGANLNCHLRIASRQLLVFELIQCSGYQFEICQII